MLDSQMHPTKQCCYECNYCNIGRVDLHRFRTVRDGQRVSAQGTTVANTAGNTVADARAFPPPYTIHPGHMGALTIKDDTC